MKSLILVDSSYTSFYRFFATLRWYSFAHKEEYKLYKEDSKYDWKENNIFIEKYEKMYLSSIEKLIGKKIFKDSDIIFCMDSPKDDLWRTELKKCYKGDRLDLSIKTNFKPTFDYTYNVIIPNLIKNNKNIYSMRVNRIEADDIIAIITMNLKNTNKPIYIVSGDEDFHQLGRNNVMFANYKMKKIFSLTEEEANIALKHKILFGDVSDCIPSIFPKGKRINKEEIMLSDEKLKEYLKNNKDMEKQYESNKIMIDFNNIPKKYNNIVIKNYNKMIEK